MRDATVIEKQTGLATEGLAVRVRHDQFDVVVRKGFVERWLDDRRARQAGGGCDAHALLPEAQVARGTEDVFPVVSALCAGKSE